MNRFLCWLFGHSYVNIGFMPDADSAVYPVNVLCECARCGRRGWDPVAQLVPLGFVPVQQEAPGVEPWRVDA